ncbi:hypothetical protein H131_15208 [Lysinibacillus sphaericus OT4b.31]|uniref:Uncharacterized protein n=1 Tax=Lysinibacillus sphaericus OT4b.31 TaxID=1285586 RepID=R7ZCL5_LYSSH|nr:hypothetical protein H131_15208 [Lysinibacillus sphaericus OT4b.31]
MATCYSEFFYPVSTVSKTPTSSGKMKTNQLGARSTDRISPIGSTNNQWGMKKTPTD